MEKSEICLPSPCDQLSTIALDMGGTLIKVVYYQKHAGTQSDQSTEHHHLEGKLMFKCFDGEAVGDVIRFIQGLVSEATLPVQLVATGGGAHKHASQLEAALGLPLAKEDEMDCLIQGLHFLVLQLPYESFVYRDAQPMLFEACPQPDALFPYILVNIGSGVSIIKVTGPQSHERISGSAVGGGTFWGLASLLLPSTDSFDAVIDLAAKGDHRRLDLLVGDIYGADYARLGLAADLVASSFGKAFKTPRAERLAHPFKEEDVAASLLFAIATNIGQIACLNAQLHGIKRIYFGGFFIRRNPITMKAISFAVDFWSGGTMKSHYLRHEGYLGALGAFLRSERRRDRAPASGSPPEARSPSLASPSAVHAAPIVRSPSLSDAFAKRMGVIDAFPVLISSPSPDLLASEPPLTTHSDLSHVDYTDIDIIS